MSKMDFGSSYVDAMSIAKNADSSTAYERAIASGDFIRDCHEHEGCYLLDDVVVDFDEMPYLCMFCKQWLSLPPTDVCSEADAVNAAAEKALICDAYVRLIGDDAAGFIYTDRNSGVKYIDIFTPEGEFDLPYNEENIAEVLNAYMPGITRYAVALKQKGRSYNIAMRFFMELLNIPEDMLEGALAYLAGELIPDRG